MTEQKRNTFFEEIIQEKFGNIMNFWREYPIHHYSRIHRLITCSDTPYTKEGTYKKELLEIACILNTPVDVLFPEKLYRKFMKKRVKITSFSDLPSVIPDIILAVHDECCEEERSECREAIGRVINALPERERFIITHRFCLDGATRLTQEVLGGLFNITRERVRQIEREVLEKLRVHPLGKSLRELYP